MDYLIKVKKGDYWQKEEVSHMLLFNKLCELIEKKEYVQVYTVVGQTEYPSLRYNKGKLSIKNLKNENEREFKEEWNH